MIPQPSRRGRFHVRCSCGWWFFGPTRWAGHAYQKYSRHWRREHEGERLAPHSP